MVSFTLFTLSFTVHALALPCSITRALRWLSSLAHHSTSVAAASVTAAPAMTIALASRGTSRAARATGSRHQAPIIHRSSMRRVVVAHVRWHSSMGSRWRRPTFHHARIIHLHARVFVVVLAFLVRSWLLVAITHVATISTRTTGSVAARRMHRDRSARSWSSLNHGSASATTTGPWRTGWPRWTRVVVWGL